MAAGQQLVLRVSWASCESDTPCAGAESFVLLDPETRALVERREELVASWYTTAGDFDEPRTGAAVPLSLQAENTWRAPLEPGVAAVWVVLRDGRGGAGYATYNFQVE